jgi:hypothetical protein
MTDHLDREDVSAMRREGDFKAYLRQGIRRGQSAFTDGLEQFRRQSSRPPADLPAATGHVPGAWPVGPSDTGTEADGRTTCDCTRCRSYAKEQPELAELLRRTQAYLDDPNT